MKLPVRKTTRLGYYDYTLPAYYFITVCTHNRRHLFGEILEGTMLLNATGRLVKECWELIPLHNSTVHLDLYCVMPNHLHGIIVIDRKAAGDACVAPPADTCISTVREGGCPGPRPQSISAMVGAFKSATGRKLNAHAGSGKTTWQRGFYDHVIRSEESLYAIRGYIQTNAVRWHLDRMNSKRTGEDDFEKWLKTQTDLSSRNTAPG